MRLATFTLDTGPRQPRVGALLGGRILDLPARSLKELLGRGKPALDEIRRLLDRPPAQALHDLASVTFLPPVPDADKFLCAGKNYRTHLEELQRTDLIKELPTEPTGFIKLNSCLTGHDTDVERPPSVVHLDYEPELVFVIGRRARRTRRASVRWAPGSSRWTKSPIRTTSG